ncbi:hypothetical protein GCM10017776_23250 [Streptomyces griseoluteus]|nr:hypothetical protein GCM10017776_23250 [Streptomyces griseoluteus]
MSPESSSHERGTPSPSSARRAAAEYRGRTASRVPPTRRGPVRIADESDPYRKGMLVMARAAQRAERAWLEEALRELDPPPTP